MSPAGCTVAPRPTFSWTRVAGATSYWLIVSDMEDMNHPSATWWVNVIVTGTSHVPSEPFPRGATFYWKVKTRFGEQGGRWSGARRFTGSENCTPPQVSLTGAGHAIRRAPAASRRPPTTRTAIR